MCGSLGGEEVVVALFDDGDGVDGESLVEL